MTQWAWRSPHAPMSHRLPCPPAPGPLEAYATQFDDLFGSLAQRRGFRAYLQGRLLPRDRNKTLTALVGAEPVAGAQHREVQRLQCFLSAYPSRPGTRKRSMPAAWTGCNAIRPRGPTPKVPW